MHLFDQNQKLHTHAHFLRKTNLTQLVERRSTTSQIQLEALRQFACPKSENFYVVSRRNSKGSHEKSFNWRKFAQPALPCSWSCCTYPVAWNIHTHLHKHTLTICVCHRTQYVVQCHTWPKAADAVFCIMGLFTSRNRKQIPRAWRRASSSTCENEKRGWAMEILFFSPRKKKLFYIIFFSDCIWDAITFHTASVQRFLRITICGTL